MKPDIKQVLPVYPDYIHVQWTVEDKEGAFLGADVLRSTSPAGPYDTIASDLDSSTFFYTDYDVNLSGLSTKYWYILKANSTHNLDEYVLSTAKTVEYTPEKGYRGRIVRRARRDLGVILERLNGVRVIILKKKRFGPRCSKCFNPVTKDTIYSSCNTCYATSYEGGYHDPVYTFGKLDPVPVQPSLGASGTTEAAITGLTIADYPDVEYDDIVIESHTNRRFKVQRKVTTEGSRAVAHQDLQISELSRDASEYLIPVELGL